MLDYLKGVEFLLPFELKQARKGTARFWVGCSPSVQALVLLSMLLHASLAQPGLLVLAASR